MINNNKTYPTLKQLTIRFQGLLGFDKLLVEIK